MWDADTIGRLRDLHGEGMSGKQIAVELGCSRNAVLGKLHRLGLLKRVAIPDGPQAKPVRRERRRAQSTVGVAKAPPSTKLLRPRVVVVEDAARPPISFMELRNGRCRWPMWGSWCESAATATEPFFDLERDRFCGGRSVVGSPYCKNHAALSYQPLQQRKSSHGATRR